VSEAYIAENLRRQVEAATAARKRGKLVEKEAKKRQAQWAMIHRFTEGSLVRDKRTGYVHKYLRNVHEEDGERYLLETQGEFRHPNIKFSVLPTKEIVRAR